MANGQLDSVLRHVRKLVAAERGGLPPDRELLERFVQQRDEEAFAALVQRHGPMVLGVCRRVLRHEHDAEDACQAAFLILARKAAAVRKRDSLRSFLHGVAYRAAANLQRAVAQRQAHERPVADLPPANPTDVTWREVCAILDEELRRLPEQFQAPVLLCYLEGKTRDEAAQELGWTLGTLRGRLERGRELLRARLRRRGVNLSAALLAALLTKQAVAAPLPAALVVRLVKPATTVVTGQLPGPGVLPDRVVALMEGVLRAMLVTKLKTATAVVLLASLAGLALGTWYSGTRAAQAAEEPQTARRTAEPPGQRQPEAGDRDPAEDAVQLAQNQARSRNNLKQLALAMHNYADAMGTFPPPAIYAGKAGMQPDKPRGGAPGAPGGIPAPGMQPPGRPPTRPGTGTGMQGSNPFGAGVGSPGTGPMSGGAGIMGISGMPGTGGMRGMMGGGAGAGGTVVGGKGGKALLSWRVALLPYLEEHDLYRQFKLDEPWDSPHNKPLLKKMPKVFAPPAVKTPEPYSTFYQVFVGPHAAFEKHRGVRMVEITDGTSNTILIAEAGSAVPWTKPEDLHFAPDEPIPQLGGLFPGMFHVAMADGAVLALSKQIDADTLGKAIMRDDGFPIDLARFRAPASRREAELRQQNERLKHELERERARLEDLRRVRKDLQDAVEDTASEELQKENDRLDQQLRKVHDEARRLQEEIQRLKKPPGRQPSRN